MARQVSPHKRTRDLIVFLTIGLYMDIDHLKSHDWQFWVFVIVMILVGWAFVSTEDDS